MGNYCLSGNLKCTICSKPLDELEISLDVDTHFECIDYSGKDDGYIVQDDDQEAIERELIWD